MDYSVQLRVSRALPQLQQRSTSPAMVPRKPPISKCGSSAGDQLQNQHYDSCYQQQVDKPSQRITAHQSDQPQNEQDYEDGPKHPNYLLRPKALASNKQHTLGRHGVEAGLFVVGENRERGAYLDEAKGLRTVY